MRPIGVAVLAVFLLVVPILAQAAAPGNGLMFDGVDDYVNIGHGTSLDLGNALTIEVWVKATDLSQRRAIFSTRLNNEAGAFQLEIGPGNGGVNRIAVTGLATYVAETGDNAIIPNQWTHITYTRSGTGTGQQAIYVNGYPQTLLTSVSYTFVNNTSDKVIGKGTLAGQFFAGQIDELRVWGVSRTDAVAEADRLHELAGTESGLRAYYRFNETSGTALADLTANANNGTLTNMAGTEWTASVIPWFEQTPTGLPNLIHDFVTWGDYDNDDYLDVLVAGSPNPGVLSGVYRNNHDGTFTDIAAGLTPVATSPTVAWGDYDNDGNLDILLAGKDAGGTNVSRVYHNNGDGTFTDIAAGLLGVYNAAAAWGDYDNDGKPDLLLAGYTGTNRITRLYHNDGGGAFSDSGIVLPGVSLGSAAWGDYDGDGFLDILLAGYLDGGAAISRVYHNNGDGTFTDIAAGLHGVYYYGSAVWGDYDNDGRLDIALTGNDSSIARTSKLYHNNGDGTFTDASAAAGLTNLTNSWVAWGDYDNDGKSDLFFTGEIATGVVRGNLYHSEGSGLFTQSQPPPWVVTFGSGAWGDADNDGKLDLLIIGAGGSGSGYRTRLQHNVGTTANTPPAAPSNLSATVTGGVTTLAWDAASDAETPAGGLTYNLRVGTTPGAANVFAGMADLTTGRRRVAAMGNVNHNLRWSLHLPPGATYYWSVQAVDTAFAGGAWAATEGTVTVPNQPAVTTATVTDMTATTAQCGGNVTAQGDSLVSSRGVVWNSTGAPTLASHDGITSDGSGLGAFTSTLSGLSSGQTYYVRAYATSAAGTSYGVQRAFVLRDAVTAMTPPGNALVFDGASSQYVTVPNAGDLGLTGSHTIEVWFKAGALAGLQGLVSKNQTAGASGWSLRLNGTEVEFDGLSTSGLGLAAGTWYHLAAVKNGSSYLLYVNGAPVALAGTGTVQLTGDAVRIGSHLGGNYFTGRMDEVRLWSRALSAQEVRESMHLVLGGGESGLVAYYDFDEASSTTLHDRAQPASVHTGTLAGMTGSEWARSTLPAGSGSANTQAEALGAVSFSGANLTMSFGSAGTADITATRIANGPPNVGPNGELLSPYWAVDRFGTGSFSASLTFTLAGGLLAENQTTPAMVHLYSRATNSDGAWTWVADAASVNATNQTATFNAITAFGQFAIAHDIMTRLPATLSHTAGGDAVLAWGDYDNDGYLDVAFAGGGSNAIFHNNGNGTFTNIGASLPSRSNYNAVAWGDYDKDGYLDLAIASGNGTSGTVMIYRNNGNGTFSLGVDLGVLVKYYQYLAWGDYDNDGYPDLASGNTNRPYLFHNNGNGTFTDIASGWPTDSNDSAAAWGDYDNDGRLDLAISGRIFHNDGNGAFTLNADAGVLSSNRGGCAWGDYDNDGLLDIAETGNTYGLHVYHNNGDGTFTDAATLVPQNLLYGSVAWGDYDNDGYLDVLSSSGDYSAEHVDIPRIFHNNGDGTFTDTGATLIYNDPPNVDGQAAWGDYDNDGKLDTMVMQSDATYLYRNVCASANTPPAAPSGLAASFAGGVATLGWNAASDGETPSNGLTYNLRIGTAPGTANVFPGQANLATGWRRLPALGNTNLNRSWSVGGLANGTYYWSVQAVDSAFSGGAWATEQSFTAGGPGEASKAGSPMTAAKGSGTTVNIAYTPAGCSSDHAIYWGESPIAGSLAWSDAACGEGTSGSANFDPGAPSSGTFYYFVIVGNNGTSEGSYGKNSSNAERPVNAGIECKPQSLPGACP